MNFIFKTMYATFWFSAIAILFYLLYKIKHLPNSESELVLWSSIAILISAFLASLSVMISIMSSKKIAKDTKDKEQIKTNLHLQYLILALNNELKQYSVTKIGTEKFFEENKQVLVDYNVLNLLKKDNENFQQRLKHLENPNLLLHSSDKVANYIVHICLNLANIIKVTEIIINMGNVDEKQWKSFMEKVEFNIKNIKDYIKQIESSRKKDNAKSNFLDDIHFHYQT